MIFSTVHPMFVGNGSESVYFADKVFGREYFVYKY